MLKRYKISCTKCKKIDHVLIDTDKNALYFESGAKTNLTAARWRKDMTWGYECICGNYDLLAEVEKKDFDTLVSGSPSKIMDIAKILKSKPIVRFKMEAVGEV